jgi:hypothetical protein
MSTQPLRKHLDKDGMPACRRLGPRRAPLLVSDPEAVTCQRCLGSPSGWQWSYVEPCGTLAAYRRHLRHDEKPCGACARANRLAAAERRAARKRLAA